MSENGNYQDMSDSVGIRGGGEQEIDWVQCTMSSGSIFAYCRRLPRLQKLFLLQGFPFLFLKTKLRYRICWIIEAMRCVLVSVLHICTCSKREMRKNE